MPACFPCLSFTFWFLKAPCKVLKWPLDKTQRLLLSFPHTQTSSHVHCYKLPPLFSPSLFLLRDHFSGTSFPAHCALFSCFWMLSPNFTKILGFNIHFYSCDPWIIRCLPDTSVRLGHYYSKNNILPWNFIFMIYIYSLRLRSCYPSMW